MNENSKLFLLMSITENICSYIDCKKTLYKINNHVIIYFYENVVVKKKK